MEAPLFRCCVQIVNQPPGAFQQHIILRQMGMLRLWQVCQQQKFHRCVLFQRRTGCQFIQAYAQFLLTGNSRRNNHQRAHRLWNRIHLHARQRPCRHNRRHCSIERHARDLPEHRQACQCSPEASRRSRKQQKQQNCQHKTAAYNPLPVWINMQTIFAPLRNLQRILQRFHSAIQQQYLRYVRKPPSGTEMQRGFRYRFLVCTAAKRNLPDGLLRQLPGILGHPRVNAARIARQALFRTTDSPKITIPLQPVQQRQRTLNPPDSPAHFFVCFVQFLALGQRAGIRHETAQRLQPQRRRKQPDFRIGQCHDLPAIVNQRNDMFFCPRIFPCLPQPFGDMRNARLPVLRRQPFPADRKFQLFLYAAHAFPPCLHCRRASLRCHHLLPPACKLPLFLPANPRQTCCTVRFQRSRAGADHLQCRNAVLLAIHTKKPPEIPCTDSMNSFHRPHTSMEISGGSLFSYSLVGSASGRCMAS